VVPSAECWRSQCAEDGAPSGRESSAVRLRARGPIRDARLVRYIDTGARDPKQALGTWLGDVIFGSPIAVSALRIQTGFFGSGILGYFEDILDDLAANDLPTRFLVGSNEGQTPRGAIEDLLAVAGAPRPNLQIGIVSFVAGYFHSKVVHFEREDGSSAAYVGSANLTPPGVNAT